MKTLSEMVREAGLPEAWISKNGVLSWEQLKRFSKLVRDDERARMAEQPAQLAWTDKMTIDVPDQELYKAQPAQQEPVSVPDCGEAGHADGACGNRECLPSFRRNATPPAQRTWVSLTDEEIQTTWNSVMRGDVFTRRDVYKAIEAKLREKNT